MSFEIHSIGFYCTGVQHLVVTCANLGNDGGVGVSSFTTAVLISGTGALPQPEVMTVVAAEFHVWVAAVAASATPGESLHRWFL